MTRTGAKENRVYSFEVRYRPIRYFCRLLREYETRILSLKNRINIGGFLCVLESKTCFLSCHLEMLFRA